MSAAPVIPISEIPAPHPAKIPKGKFAPTRKADLATFSLLDRSAIGVHAHIHSESIGWGRGWTRSTVKLSTLAEHGNVDDRTIQKAVTQEERDGRIERRKVSGGYEYKRVRPIDYDGKEVWGNNCQKCKEPTPFAVDRDTPIPHTLFLNVFRATDRGVFLCAMAIALRTLRGSKDGQLHIHPSQMSIDELKTSTRLQKSELEADLKTGEAMGIFQSAGRKGSVQTYWVTPENWANLTVRSKRVGGNPAPVKQKRKGECKIETIKQSTQQDRKQTSPPEFWLKPCGTCLQCGEWTAINVVPPPENPVKKPLARAREGPIPRPFSNLPTFERDPWLKNG